jgi:hypothetical protein
VTRCSILLRHTSPTYKKLILSGDLLALVRKGHLTIGDKDQQIFAPSDQISAFDLAKMEAAQEAAQEAAALKAAAVKAAAAAAMAAAAALAEAMAALLIAEEEEDIKKTNRKGAGDNLLTKSSCNERVTWSGPKCAAILESGQYGALDV